MYITVYMNDFSGYYGLVHQAPTIAECGQYRMMAGDLVFNAETKEIVQDDSWLFPWEREDANCYARRKMAQKTTLRRAAS
jgi:hypothetical protein